MVLNDVWEEDASNDASRRHCRAGHGRCCARPGRVAQQTLPCGAAVDTVAAEGAVGGVVGAGAAVGGLLGGRADLALVLSIARGGATHAASTPHFSRMTKKK